MNESVSFELKATRRKGIWTISLGQDTLTLTAVDGNESFELTRPDAEEKIVLFEPRASFANVKPSLIVRIPKRKLSFKLEHAQAASLKQWLGPPTIRGLKVALKRRLRWCIPFGILWILGSLPLPADPEAGTEAIPFDILGAFLGVSLISLSILAEAPRLIRIAPKGDCPATHGANHPAGNSSRPKRPISLDHAARGQLYAHDSSALLIFPDPGLKRNAGTPKKHVSQMHTVKR